MGRHRGDRDVRCNVIMKRTQISLDVEARSWLRREARLHGCSVASIIRGLIHEAERRTARQAGSRQAPKGEPPGEESFPWVGLGKGGPATDAALADEYLYGEGEAL
jgi:hypothetical protein